MTKSVPRGPYLRLRSLTERPVLHRIDETVGAPDAPQSWCSVSGRRTAIVQRGPLTVMLEGDVRFGPSGPTDIDAIADRFATDYSERGAIAIASLTGPFSVVVHDHQRGEVALAVDRLGVHSLCYCVAGGGRVLIGPDPETASAQNALSLQSVYDYFFFHMIPSPRTIFADTAKVRPAECVVISSDGATSHPYWSADFTYERFDEPRHAAELRSTLAQAVERATLDDHPAAFLSGGLDSSTVVGYAAQSSAARTTAFTMGFDVPGYDEVAFAKITAQHFGVPLQVYYLTPDDVLQTLDIVAQRYGEPFGNSSAIPTYHCARTAAEAGHQSILAGDGGDEFFAGNERYRTQEILRAYQLVPRWARAKVLEPLLDGPWGETDFLPIRKARGYSQQARQALPDRLHAYNFLHRFGPATIFEEEFVASVSLDHPLAHAREVYHSGAVSDPTDRLLLMDWKLTLADNDLRKVSTMCDAAGIAVTYPMMDENLVAFSTRISGRDKMRFLQLRRFYKAALKDFLSPKTLSKSKHGFGMPFGPWLQKSPGLMERTQDSLNDFAKRGIIRADYIADLQSGLLDQHADYFGGMIWVILALENWLQARPALRNFSL